MACTITVTGPVRVTDDATGADLRDPKRVARVVRLRDAAETIADYFGPELSALGITGGAVRLAAASEPLPPTSSPPPSSPR